MNNQPTELYKDLKEIAKKHNLTTIVFIAEQDQENIVKDRAILIGHKTYDEYANLVTNCITSSDTFAKLMHHYWAHTLNDMHTADYAHSRGKSN